MISGLIINPRLSADKKEVLYTLDPYDRANGPIRSFLKYEVILLTTQKTDPIRPWLGTHMPEICKMNIVATDEIKLYVREQLESAIQQFFRLQAEEREQNNQTTYDIISDIEIMSIDITADHRIQAVLKFTPMAEQAVAYSIDI